MSKWRSVGIIVLASVCGAACITCSAYATWIGRREAMPSSSPVFWTETFRNMR